MQSVAVICGGSPTAAIPSAEFLGKIVFGKEYESADPALHQFGATRIVIPKGGVRPRNLLLSWGRRNSRSLATRKTPAEREACATREARP